MRAVVQRVAEARVLVESEVVGEIGRGLLVLLGAQQEDTERDLHTMLDKILHLRIFDDEAGKLNLGLLDVDGELLVISQFTLLGDCRKGRRPSFVEAMRPESAERLLDEFVRQARQRVRRVETGRFGAMMRVQLENSGPVTLIIDSRKSQ
ncbi:MAG: D-tyrosyl-tRNA(Tyr) deacylase [Bradymonadales bacterium]|nr:D-tyrosyl-tRNA(Tyr) deacylase [Bradymonadales bacterium]